MEKTAQRNSGKRSVLNKLKEMSNVSGIAAEKLFNPEFERVMNSLRETDNKIRAIVSGQDIEGEDPGADLSSLKDLYKSAKSNINRREYMTAIAFLGRFHKKLHEVFEVINKLHLDVDKVHNDFLFKNLDEDQKKHLSELKSRLAFNNSSVLIAEASIMDFLVNVGTERGKALAAWEKRYPKQIGKLKKDAMSLLQKTESALTSVIMLLKEMANFRASRKVDDYEKSAKKVQNIYLNYDKYFREFYNDNIKNFLEKQEFVAPTKEIPVSNLGQQNISAPVSKTNLPEIPDLNVPVQNSAPSLQSNETVINNEPEESQTLDLPNAEKIKELEKSLSKAPNLPTHTGPTTPPPIFRSIEEKESEPVSSNPVIPAAEELQVATHRDFYNTLQKIAHEHPLIISEFIKKYALAIKASDTNTSLQLLKISKAIKSNFNQG